MRFKIKINENTTYNDISIELDKIKKSNVKTIPLNYIRKITSFLDCEEIPGKGSSVRFYNAVLISHSFYNGYFQVHKIHKGGNKDEIRKSDFVKYLLPALKIIIENKN